MNKNISTFIACDNEYKDSKVVLFGAPFDGTTSFRPGTRFASSVVRNESYGLETYSPYLDLDMEDVNIFDGGDLEFCFGNAKKVLDEISSYTSKVLNDNKVPFMIGGEHLVTLGTFREVAKKYEGVHIIHLDAHTDLREDYMGEELSHASVIRRCYDIVGRGKIFQFGIRSGMKEEFLFGREHCSLKSDFEGIDEVVNNLKDKHLNSLLFWVTNGLQKTVV